MNEATIHQWLLLAWLLLAAAVCALLFFVPAPYGRHTRSGFGPTINRRLGWVLMELPAAAVFAVCFILDGAETSACALVFLAAWEIHYINRSLIFPFRMRGGSRNLTVLAVMLAVIFNSVNGYLNGRYLYGLGPSYPDHWLTDPRFVVGMLLFFSGMAVNQHSDRVLFRLRSGGETGYKIPRGGMFKFVSNPNYLGELMEWVGWAVATWSLAGLAFAAWTAANLVPRAWTNHKWYKKTFSDYPRERRALIPYVF